MVQINFAQKQVNAKIVYYGPGMSGKTTNLEIIHQRAPKDNRGELTSISTDGDRTLFFDFMPLDLGTVAGMRTCFQIYTVPGQVYYNSTRKLVLQGVDGVIFVADSSASMIEENIESMKNLDQNLAEYGRSLEDLPLVIQYNKRDLPDAMPVEELDKALNPRSVPAFEGIAHTGQGVFPTLKALAARVIETIHTQQRHSVSPGAGPAEPAPAPAAPPQPAAHAPQPGQPPQQPAAPQQVAGYAPQPGYQQQAPAAGPGQVPGGVPLDLPAAPMPRPEAAQAAASHVPGVPAGLGQQPGQGRPSHQGVPPGPPEIPASGGLRLSDPGRRDPGPQASGAPAGAPAPPMGMRPPQRPAVAAPGQPGMARGPAGRPRARRPEGGRQGGQPGQGGTTARRRPPQKKGAAQGRPSAKSKVQGKGKVQPKGKGKAQAAQRAPRPTPGQKQQGGKSAAVTAVIVIASVGIGAVLGSLVLSAL